ncbi:MAG: cytochrome P450 [Actinomycetota bacterium]
MGRATEAEAVAVELFRTPEGRADPYPRYHRLRELDPVHRSETARSWLLTRYEDCYSALRDPRLGKDFAERMDNTRPWWRERPSLARFEHSMLNVDGAYHTRLRRLVSKVFTFRSVEKLRPAIERMVDGFLDPLADAGVGDLIDDLGFPLPVTVIGELLGVPEGDRAQFRDLVRDVTATFEVAATREQFDAADEAIRIIDAYFYDLVARKRARPGDDLLSGLVHAEDKDGLTDTELVTLATLLFAAGFETTTNLVGNGMIGFLRQPEQIDKLRNHPELYASIADEILRFDGTAQMVVRQAKEDVDIDGQLILRGETVTAVIGAGNHDPSRYSDPDRIDLTRTEIRPLSFGGGVHFCLGAALARAEIEIVFRKLFDRFATIELDGDEPPFRDRLTLRGLTRLPLRLSSRPSQRAPLPAAERGPSGAAPPDRTDIQRPARKASGTLPSRPRGRADALWRAAYRWRIERTPPPPDPATVELLGRIPLFAGCSGHELDRLASTAYPIAFDAMDVLCSEGADAQECYVVSEGEATVTIGGEVVAQVGPDDVVGEKGPLEGTPRAATVTATTHMVTYAISRDELLALVERSPAASQAMRAELGRRYG